MLLNYGRQRNTISEQQQFLTGNFKPDLSQFMYVIQLS